MAELLAANVRAEREYFERIDPFTKYNDKKFKRRYRLPKDLVRTLAADFGESPFAGLGTKRGNGISHELRMCIALRFYAAGSMYEDIADVHGVERSTVSRAVAAVSNYFCMIHQRHIRWPRKEEFAARALKFAGRGIPRIIGIVDGTHVAIKGPSMNEHLYVNRKGWHSLNVQVICDNELRFIHVDATQPGSQNDQWVFKNSAVGMAAAREELDGYWLLGDSGYTIKPWIMTPFDVETNENSAYNTAHKKTRSCVERAIGVWKQRFRCLDDSGGMLQSPPAASSRIVLACAVLHNIAITHRLEEEEDDNEDGDGYRRRYHRVQPDENEEGGQGDERRQDQRDPVNPEYQVDPEDKTGVKVRETLMKTRFPYLGAAGRQGQPR